MHPSYGLMAHPMTSNCGDLVNPMIKMVQKTVLRCMLKHYLVSGMTTIALILRHLCARLNLVGVKFIIYMNLSNI